MDKTAKREELAALLRSLSPADTAWLRQRLLRRDSVALLQDTGRISPQELLSVESWLWERAAAARPSGPITPTRWKRTAACATMPVRSARPLPRAAR